MSRWILQPNQTTKATDDDRCRIFCFPPAGYGAWIYQKWQDSLGDLADVWPIEYPGKNSRMREAPVDDLKFLALAIFENLRSELEKGPCVFFGHSMGGWIAYEVIKLMNCGGIHTVMKLYASGVRSPVLYGSDFDPDPTQLGDLEFKGFWRAFEKRYGLNANLKNETLLRCVYPSFRADYTMIENYRLTGDEKDVQISCPITALAGEMDARVTSCGLYAWKHVAASGFSVWQIPGCGHDCIHRDNEQLLTALRTDLADLLLKRN